MKQSEWLRLVALIKALWPHFQPQPDTVEAWYHELATLEANDVERAIRTAAVDNQWPSLKALMDAGLRDRVTQARIHARWEAEYEATLRLLYTPEELELMRDRAAAMDAADQAALSNPKDNQ